MGSNNKKNTPATAGSSGSDPRGRVQNQIEYQQNRFNSQQEPMANAMAGNYGRGSEANYGDYTDIMNNYRAIASGPQGGSSGSVEGGGGGGGTTFNAYTVNPRMMNAERASVRGLGPLERVKASDPFKSYGGYEEFSKTGGYSGQDIADMRARGIAPIRAAYGNAERNVQQQRSLQGGYSPNAIASQIKMAREQGQGMADASQAVDAGIAQARNQGRLAGLSGMQGIEGQRLGAQMQGDIFNAGQANEGQKFDIGNEMNVSQFNAGQGNQVGMFNSNLDMQGQQYNADARTRADQMSAASAASAAARADNARAQGNADRLTALQGMSNLYGTTPGMSQLFGNQLLDAVQMGGNFGQGMINSEGNAQALPGAYDQTMGRVRDVAGTIGQVGYPLYEAWQNRNQNQQQAPTTPYTPGPNIGIGPGMSPNPFGQPSDTQRRLTGGGGMNVSFR